MLQTELQCKLRMCANCRETSYCSSECQQRHWRIHKRSCKLKNPFHFDADRLATIKRLQSMPTYHALLLAPYMISLNLQTIGLNEIFQK